MALTNVAFLTTAAPVFDSACVRERARARTRLPGSQAWGFRPSRVAFRMRGPSTPPPDYTDIDSNPFNAKLTEIFRSKLEAELGHGARQDGYAGVVEVVKALSTRHKGDPAALRAASERVLESLFPSWLPPAFDRIFSRTVPQFAAWINAAVTVAVTQWLMGPSKLAEDGTTVEIERCRYLEGKKSSTAPIWGTLP